jgi:hypothetical protein
MVPAFTKSNWPPWRLRGAPICLEAYIFQESEIARRYVDTLTERARGGLQVNVVLDGLGSAKATKEYFRDFTAAGGKLAWYNPIRWNKLPRYNNRTHREPLIVDVRTAFIGGAGVADHWYKHGRRDARLYLFSTTDARCGSRASSGAELRFSRSTDRFTNLSLSWRNGMSHHAYSAFGRPVQGGSRRSMEGTFLRAPFIFSTGFTYSCSRPGIPDAHSLGTSQCASDLLLSLLNWSLGRSRLRGGLCRVNTCKLYCA